MKCKALITLAVAGACASPLIAAAGGQIHGASAAYWDVATPSSVSESAPWATADRFSADTARHAAQAAAASTAMAEVMTPHSPNESAPWRTEEDMRQRRAAPSAQAVSIASPQTPYSPNESGPERYTEAMQAHAEQVAAVEQARVAAARSSSESLAAATGSSDSAADAGAAHAAIMSAPEAPRDQRDGEHLSSSPAGIVDSRQSGIAVLRTDANASTGDGTPEAAVGASDGTAGGAEVHVWTEATQPAAR